MLHMYKSEFLNNIKIIVIYYKMDSSISEYINTIKQKDLEINEKDNEIDRLKSKIERIMFNYESLDLKYDKIKKSISEEQLKELIN